jgi:NADPH:quinone reductase-like Zn-dependent oxidoreductase
MKAIIYRKYGSPAEFQLKEVEKPIPKKDEVLVKIVASSVNSWDWDMLRGSPFLVRVIGGLFKPRHKILGADVAGKVEATGSNVKDFKPGDEVFGDIAGNGFGGFAEYIAVPEKLLAKKSIAMSFEQAASLPQAGFLALQGLNYKGTLKKGDQVLINGAGGGVGTIALQYAKLQGAIVTCVDKTEKFELLRSLGADYFIDYTTEDYTKTGKQYDRILDVIAHRSIGDYKRALKPGGTFAMVGGSMGGLLAQLVFLAPFISKFTNKNIGLMGYKPNRKDLNYFNQLFEEGKLKPIIDRSYPLKDVPMAFQYFSEGNVKGKIVISLATPFT